MGKRFKTLLVLLLVIMLTVGLAPGAFGVLAAGSATQKTGDDGTTNYDFIIPVTHQKSVPKGYTAIRTAQDLANIKNNLSGNYIMMSNVDLSKLGNWTPIGTGTGKDSFSGTFDGNGYVISNLSIIGDFQYAGLFGYTDAATIKNVGLEKTNIDITAETSYPYSISVGGVCAAFYKNGKSGAISNCYNNGIIAISSTISSTSCCIGGICGSNDSFNNGSFTISNCFNSSTVSALSTSDSGTGNAGGICGVGDGNITISNCINTGKISASTNAGGIFGWWIGLGTVSNCTISMCNNGGVISSGQYAGGVGGDSFRTDITINNCSNTGAIYAFSNAGGIFGSDLINNNSTIISRCYNTGTVSAGYFSGSYSGVNTYAGGICAAGSNSTTSIDNCYNTGAVSATSYTGSYAGGICGENGSISNCYNLGAISADYNNHSPVAGGICGFSGSISGCCVWSSGITADVSYTIGWGATTTNNLALSGISGNPKNDDTKLITAAESKQQNIYENLGWDLKNIWAIDSNINNGYPYLRESQAVTNGSTNTIQREPSATAPPSVPALTAVPTNSSVFVNDKKIAFDAYTINGNNYFKLRDLAYVLNGTEKQFEISYDATNNAISLASGKPYTIAGGELTVKGSGNKTPVPTNSKIYIDGKEVTLTTYNIDGNNYFKLRDVGQAFNFGVIYDAANNSIVIDTSKDYTMP